MTEETPTALTVLDCWNTVGVRGDRSCPKLVLARHCDNCGVFADAARQLLDRPPPAGYLEELTSLMAKSVPEAAKPVALSAVLFEIGDQTLAIDTVQVVEVTEPRPVHRVGHRSGRIFSGLANIHGQLELCASLRGLLQIGGDLPAAASQGSRARMLLVELLGQRWVFDADAVLGVQRFFLDDVSNVPATSHHDGSGFIKSVLVWNDRRVAHLDLEKVFAALKRSIR